MGLLSVAIKMRCPKCGKGKLYENTGVLPQKGWFDMLKTCSHCGFKYEKEVGFFYGAMYVSYMLNIALFVTATIGYYLFFEEKVAWQYYILIYVFITFLLIKQIFRMSRSLWLMMMVKSDQK